MSALQKFIQDCRKCGARVVGGYRDARPGWFEPNSPGLLVTDCCVYAEPGAVVHTCSTTTKGSR